MRVGSGWWSVAVLASTAVLVGIALLGLPTVNDDARSLVIGATVVGGAAGLASAFLVRHGPTRLAGVLVIVSAVTPTYAAAVLNLIPIVLGLALLLLRTTLRDRQVSRRRPAV